MHVPSAPPPGRTSILQVLVTRYICSTFKKLTVFLQRGLWKAFARSIINFKRGLANKETLKKFRSYLKAENTSNIARGKFYIMSNKMLNKLLNKMLYKLLNKLLSNKPFEVELFLHMRRSSKF